ncbi:hypothetical protein DUT90_01915 [Polaribacter sp. WD7]|nr:hypothetical protein DUT90_01915 [Polaribacter sp. WD7]
MKHLEENKICEKFILKNVSANFEKTDKLGEWISRGELCKSRFIYRYTTSVIEELYSFLLDHYKSGLNQYILFNLSFYEETFGKTYEKSKEIALNYFNTYYNQIPIHPSFKLKFDSNRNMIPTPKFESLYNYKKNLLLNIENKSELIIPYLAGNIDFYNSHLFHNNFIIKEVFEFENNLKILIELNRRFKFEEDNIFTQKSISQKIFEKYEDEFDSLKQIEFIEYQIKLKEKTIRADIVSLFDFFSNHLNIKTPSGKVFGEIINSYFDFNFSKIKLNSSESTKHFKNIEKLKKDWENFTN